ncbi:unnamed protein product [Rotaria sp. Silwood1]|nr:unnamed protein product [Rotaria sp. Silwood1]CAF1686696.1 unnamed protein product [Rotaria sp. Silwood1]
MGTWSLVGASIDRFLCSSHSATYRQWSTNRVAKRYVIGIFIFYALLFIQVFYCFEASVPNVPVACYGRNLPCRIFNDWVALTVDILLPSLFLAIFGTLTIRNVQTRVIHPIVHAVNSDNRNNNRLPMRNKERNLTRMLLVQVLIVLPLDLPFGIYRPYASLTSDVPKSAYRVAVEILTYSLIILLVYFTHSTSFYLYTLTGSIYRDALRRIARRCFNRIQPRH